MYTESTFTLLTLLGLCALYVPFDLHPSALVHPISDSQQERSMQKSEGQESKQGSKHNLSNGWQLLCFLAASLAFMLATCTRANGE